MLSRFKPSLELQQENERVMKDCKRLVAMVESTKEFQRWAGTKAVLRGVHYLPAAECLVSESIVSEVYQAERDREVLPAPPI
jgi:hypothetical protein